MSKLKNCKCGKDAQKLTLESGKTLIQCSDSCCSYRESNYVVMLEPDCAVKMWNAQFYFGNDKKVSEAIRG